MASSFLKRKAEEQAKRVEKEYGASVNGGSNSLKSSGNSKDKDEDKKKETQKAEVKSGSKASTFLQRKAQEQTERVNNELGLGKTSGSQWRDSVLNQPTAQNSNTTGITSNRTYADVKQEIDSLTSRRISLFNERDNLVNNRATTLDPRVREIGFEINDINSRLSGLSELANTLKESERQAMIDSGEYRDASFWKDAVWNSLKQGYYNTLYGEESYDAMMGYGNEAQKYKDILEGEDYKFLPSNKWEEAVSGAMNLAGQMFRQSTNEKTAALAASGTAMGAAYGAAAGGGLGSGITAPAGAIAGFSSGLMAGNAAASFEVEAGFAYNEMIENGISPDTAKKIALAVGGVNAAIEMAQVDELVDAFKILRRTGATKNAATRIAGELLDRGIDVFQETAQEVTQEAVTILGAQAAAKRDKGEGAYTWDEIKERLGDTAMSSAMSFGLMNVPAASMNTYNIVQEHPRQQANVGAEIRAIGDDAVQAVVEEGLASAPDTESYKLATAAKAKMDAGEVVSDREIGQLYAANVRDIAAEEEVAEREARVQAQTDAVREVYSEPDTIPTINQTARRTAVKPNYGEHGNATFNSIAETNTEVEPVELMVRFDTPYQAGLTGLPMKQANLIDNFQIEAYNAGRLDYIQNMAKAEKKAPGVVLSEKESGFDHTNAPSDITQEEKDFSDWFSKKLGVKGSWDGKNGNAAYNAFFDKDTGGVTFAQDFGINPQLMKKLGSMDYMQKVDKLASTRDESFIFYVGHEIAEHVAMTRAPEAMRAFTNAMYNYRQSLSPDENLARSKQAFYASHNVELDTDAAIEEVSGDSILMLYDGDAQKFMDGMRRVYESLDADAKQGAQTFREILTEVIEKLKKWVRKLTGKENAEARANMKKGISELEQLRDMFESAMAESMNAVKEDRAIRRDGKLFRTTEADGTTILETSVGNPVAMMTEDGSAVFSLKTYDDFGRAELKRWLTLKESKGQITKEESADIVKQLDEYYDLCQNFIDKYAPFGAWSKAEVVRDNKGKPVFSVVKANGEYAMNLDFSLVCKKRRTLDAVFKEMIRRGIMDDLSLEEADIAKVNEIIRSNGFETACALCFVDSKRYRQAKVADTFVEQYNSIVRQILPEDGSARAHHFDFVESGVYKDRGVGLHTLSNEQIQPGIEKLKQIMRENGKQTVAHKIAKHLLNHPADRKLVSRSDFMNTDGFGAVKLKNPAVLKLYNSSKGAGGPKAAFSDVQYLGEILKKNNFTPARAYAVGGVRIQSFSDYIPRLVFDYLQMVADLTAKKLPAHAYTKEATFVKQFGMTGIKMNMSLVPAVAEDGIAPGLDKNGDYFWFDGQSFGSDVKIKGSGKTGYELAIQIQNAPGYSQHCGTVAVGVSSEHIKKMLGDENIRMIIPYHKSSLNHIVAVMNNIDKYTDYTRVQNTRNADGTKISGKDFNFNEALRRTGDAKTAANEYLAWCKEHNYLPKFDEFAYHENYYKVLEDFSTYDNGVAAPQGAVTMTFPKQGDAFGSMAELIEQGLEEDAILEADREQSVPKIVDQVEKALQKKDDKKYSLKGERAMRSEIKRIREDGKKAGKTDAEIEQDIAAVVSPEYGELIKTYGEIKRGERPARDIVVPQRTEKNRHVSQTIRTVLEAEVTPDAAVPTIQEMIAQGDFSYDRITDKAAIAAAERTIRNKGFETAMADWLSDVKKGVVSKANTAVGWSLYNAAATKGDFKTAMTILSGMVQHQRSAAQALQATRILKKLSPEAQLYGIQKTVDGINEELQQRYGKKAGNKSVNDADNVPVELWMQRTGELLAEQLGKAVKQKTRKEKTVCQRVLADLRKLARETVEPASMPADTRTEMDSIYDMFHNKEQYEKALAAAKETVAKEYGNKPEIMNALDKWMNTAFDYTEQFTKEFTGQTEIQIPAELVDKFLSQTDQDGRDEVAREIYRYIGSQMPSRFIDKWNAWRYLAMLGNPRTHVRNVVGNLGFAPVVAAKNMTAGAIESAVSFVTGGKIERNKGRVNRKLLQAAWADYDNVAEEVSAGGKYNDSANQNKYIEEGRTVFKFKPLEKARKGNSAALEAEDIWFARPHYAYALAQYCNAHGVTADQLRRGKALGNARTYAIKEAQKATYKDTNAFSEFISKLGRYHGDNKVAKAASFVTEGILPFRKTPANILVRGLEYSPVGLLKSLTSDLYRVKKGDLTAADAIDNISAGLTGTGLLAFGLWAAAEGLIRGAGGGDEEEKKYADLQGHQTYALEIGDTSVTLDWLAPEVLPMFIGVNLYETATENSGESNMADMLTAVANVTEPLLEMSCLQSLNDLFDNIGYAATGGLSAFPKALVSAATSYLTQAFPTILGQAERSAQDVRMTTYTEKDSFFTSDMQYTLGKISAKTPGWDFQQIPYIDAWGRTESSGSKVENAANNFLNPAYMSQIETSAMEEELQRLYDETGIKGVLPDRASKYFTVNGERKDLTAEEYVEYATAKGKLSYDMLTDLINRSEYSGMNDEERAEAVEMTTKYADAVAKTTMSDYEPTGWMADAMNASKYADMDETDYMLYKVALSSIDKLNMDGDVGSYDGAEKAEAITSMSGFTDNDIAYLWDTKEGYELLDAGIDMGSYVEYVGSGRSVNAEKLIDLHDKGVAEETYYDFLDILKEHDQPTKGGKMGSYTQAEATAAIKAMPDLTREERALLWQSVNKSWKESKNPWR